MLSPHNRQSPLDHSRITVLSGTSIKVPSTPMDEHSQEESRVEKGDGRVEPGRESPSESLDPIGGVILFNSIKAGETVELTESEKMMYTDWLPCVCPPTTDQELVAVLSLNVLGVHTDTSWQLRERSPRDIDALRLHLESRLLSHGGIKDIVRGEERGKVENGQWERESVR